MKNNIENIPAGIFDLMTSHRFDELNAELKGTVLQFLSKEEYQELFESNLTIQQSLQTAGHSHVAKSQLMKLFDERHAQQDKKYSIDASLFWKAASVLLLLSTLWFAFRKADERIATVPVTVLQHDTVFIANETTAMQRTKDTVIIERPSKQMAVQSPQKKQAASNKLRAPELHQDLPVAVVPAPDFQILSVSTMNHISNSSKRNSMNDDSLEKNFRFVSM